MKAYSSFTRKASLGEVVDPVSETVPDQSLSVREIMARYVNGVHDDLYNDGGEYTEDMEDVSALDDFERLELLRSLRDSVPERSVAPVAVAPSDEGVIEPVKPVESVDDGK